MTRQPLVWVVVILSGIRCQLRRYRYPGVARGLSRAREMGNVLAETAFVYGLPAEELEPDELDVRDRGYEVRITVRAVKAAGQAP